MAKRANILEHFFPKCSPTHGDHFGCKKVGNFFQKNCKKNFIKVGPKAFFWNFPKKVNFQHLLSKIGWNTFFPKCSPTHGAHFGWKKNWKIVRKNWEKVETCGGVHDFSQLFYQKIPKFRVFKGNFSPGLRLASYRVEYTSSRPITEVKLRRAELVLAWVTGWEYSVC